MDSREILTKQFQTLGALSRGGVINLGFGTNRKNNKLQSTLQNKWDTERNLLRRVLDQAGDPEERLHEWRQRTENFMSKYPTRPGWTDRAGQQWDGQEVLNAIEKLLKEVENAQMEDEDYDAYLEDQEDDL